MNDLKSPYDKRHPNSPPIPDHHASPDAKPLEDPPKWFAVGATHFPCIYLTPLTPTLRKYTGTIGNPAEQHGPICMV